MMSRKTNILVTGGAGFIGSALCRRLVGSGNYNILNLDKLTYAGTSGSLQEIADAPDYSFVKGDICDPALIRELLATFRPDRIMHLAAESHVDRSIDNAGSFVSTNVIGTFQLLEAAVDYWKGLAPSARDDFRFHHVSTDEVYGDLASGTESIFTEHSPYRPSSPYAASKAASDHLVRAWARTYGLPVVVSNCGNNYGSFQFPEKLVPLVILNALNERPLPVYGDGSHVRDWIYVDDHVAALETIAMHGLPGETYNVGSSAVRTNLEVIGLICNILDEKHPRSGGRSYRDLIEFVADRPGHDRHYAVDASKIVEQLGWTPLETFDTGIAKTVDWYIDNAWWWAPLREARYGGERLGATPAQ